MNAAALQGKVRLGIVGLGTQGTVYARMIAAGQAGEQIHRVHQFFRKGIKSVAAQLGLPCDARARIGIVGIGQIHVIITCVCE